MTTKEPKKPKTKKQKDFFKFLAEGHSPRQAAIKAGYAESSAGHMAEETTKNHKDYWDSKLEQAGVTDEVLATKLQEGLDASKVVGYLNNKVKGTEKVSDEFVEVADYHVRHKYLDTAFKLKGSYPAEKREHSGSIGIVNWLELLNG